MSESCVVAYARPMCVVSVRVPTRCGWVGDDRLYMVHEEIGVDKITFLVNRLHLIEPMQQFLGLVFIPYISDAGSYYFMDIAISGRARVHSVRYRVCRA